MQGAPRKDPDSAYLRVFVESDQPTLTVKDVLPHVSVDHNAAYKRLEGLLDEGYLDAKKPGSSSKVYWITDAGREYLAEEG